MQNASRRGHSVSTMIRAGVAGVLLSLLAGCGGGGGGSKTSLQGTTKTPTYAVSGIVQKGQYLNGKVTLRKLNAKAEETGSAAVADISSEGNYSLRTEANGLISASAEGIYLNEYTGAVETDPVTLYAIASLAEEREVQLNVNLFTTLAYARIKALMQEGKAYGEAKRQARAEMYETLGIDPEVALGQLDMFDLSGPLKTSNVSLLLFSAAFMKSVLDGPGPQEARARGVYNPLGTRGVNDALLALRKDFGDNGKIDGEGKGLFEGIKKGSVLHLALAIEANTGLSAGSIQEDIPSWLEGGDAAIEISRFALSAVIINSVSYLYSDEDRIFIGADGDTVNLKFRYETARNSDISYDVHILATAGSEQMVAMEAVPVPSDVETLDLNVNVDEALRNFIKQAYAAGESVQFKAVTNVVGTGIVSFVTKEAEKVPELAALADTLNIASKSLSLSHAEHYSPRIDNTCDLLPVRTSAVAPHFAKYDLDVQWQPSESWSEAEGSVSEGCVELTYDGETHTYVPTLRVGKVAFEPGSVLTSENDGLKVLTLLRMDANQTGVQIEPDGSLSYAYDALVSFITLPDEIGVHLLITPPGTYAKITPQSIGTLFAWMTPKNITDEWESMQFHVVKNLTELSSSFDDTPLRFYLHTKALPFYTDITDSDIVIDGDGMHFTGASAEYIHGESSSLPSNDIFFSRPSGDFDFTVANGTMTSDTPMHFAALSGAYLHYPYSGIASEAFDTKFENGVLVPVDVDGETLYHYTYRSACYGAACGEGGASEVTYDLTGSGVHLDADGSALGSVALEGNRIAWGSKENDTYVFERKEDSAGTMYVPGFTLPTNDPHKLADMLMGSRDRDENGPAALHPLNGDTFNKSGNGLFAGINVGLLYLSEAEGGGEGSLDGTQMQVQVGGETKQEMILSNNAATKYYIRPSGVTGVFNGTLENPDVTIYGYPMAFKRFAFRQVANVLDTETWIDGKVTVPDDGGFTVDFTSLALDCTGALNGGHVAQTDCDASPTVNCAQKLALWKTNTDFISIGFTPKSADVCGDKLLRVGHLLDIKALSRPLGLTTDWTPDGKPKNAMVTGSTTNYLDAAENNESSRGFLVGLDKGSKLSPKGWYHFTGSFGLPFWGMKPVDLGLENDESGTHREKSAVLGKGEIVDTWESSLLRTTAESKVFDVSYMWGNTGLGITLPVTYDAKAATAESEFLGKKREIDLGVMNANAGINYIKPDTTKISFGASADFEAMANMNIQVNLNDPESIKKIDTMLDTFGISTKPLEHTIGMVLDPLQQVQQYADKGLLLGMEELGIRALEEAGGAVGTDPFEVMAELFVKVHTLPTQAITMTEDFIMEQIDGKLNAVYTELFGPLQNAGAPVTEELNASIQHAVAMLNDVEQRGFAALDELKSQLRDVNRTLNRIDLTSAWNRVESRIDTILPKQTSCSATALMGNSKLFAPISAMKEKVAAVNNALQSIDINLVRGFASAVEGYIDFDADDLIDTFEKTQRTAQSLNNDIASAQGKIDTKLDELCSQADTIRTQIESVVAKVTELDAIRTKVQSYVNLVYAALDSEAVSQVHNNIDMIKTYLESIGTTVTAMSDTQYQVLNSFGSKALLMAVENITIDGRSIDAFKGDLEDILSQIPQPTAQELRAMVVTTILNTEPIEKLRIAMNDVVSPVTDEVRNVAVDLIGSVNQVVYDMVYKLNAKANEMLAEATSAVKALPIKSAKMDGYANISGDEIERLHIGAEWAVETGSEESSYTFGGALDMLRWSANGKAGCGGTNDTDGNLDVKISTRDIGMDLGGKSLKIDRLYFGFTLENALPIGVMGGIESKKGFDFNEFKLYDMKLMAGIGSIETYLGATTSAIFEKYQMSVAFLVGKTCGKEIITTLDPKVGEFITLPNNVFKGAYVRGGASFPIWNNGCALTVGVSANMGVWVLIPGTYGGLIGGGAYGQALCIASLRGEVETLFEKSGDNVKFQGSGWGAAGAGWCSPSSWTSVAKSRDDDWCGTGDAQFGASYDNGWHLDTPRTSAVH